MLFVVLLQHLIFFLCFLCCCFNNNMPWRGLFWLNLFGVLEASYILTFGKFSAIILLNILCIPLGYTSSSSMPMVLRFAFLLELLSSCIFLSQLLSCFTKSFPFFFFSLILFYLQDIRSVFHFF
jgi:hypothetical protein